MNYLASLARYTLLLNRMKRLRIETLSAYSVGEYKDNPDLSAELTERLEWIDNLIKKLYNGFTKVVMSYQLNN